MIVPTTISQDMYSILKKLLYCNGTTTILLNIKQYIQNIYSKKKITIWQ